MTEREPSDLELAEAFRAYAEEASTQVRPSELARHFATVYPHRTGFGPRRLGTTGRLAWVPVLLAGLLITVAGGILIGRSHPEQNLAAGVPPFECPAGSSPDTPGPIDQARPFAWFEAAFDRRAGKLVALALANPTVHADTDDPDIVLPRLTWTFDVCTNTWTQMQPNQEPPALNGLVYDVDSDRTIGVHEDLDREPYPYVGNVWTYDLQTDTWTEKGQAPIETLSGYDPVSGLIFAGEHWSYDVETDVWTHIDQAYERGGGMCTYDASVDRIIDYEADEFPAELWLFDLRTGTWSKSGAETPVIRNRNWSGPKPTIVYDEAAERTVVAAESGWGAYDATRDQWEILMDTEPGGILGPRPMLYDPVNDRLVVRGGEPEPGVRGDLLAFDLATREWTVLLE